MNRIDDMMDQAMEMIVNHLCIAVFVLGVPYFFYVLFQFLRM